MEKEISPNKEHFENAYINKQLELLKMYDYNAEFSKLAVIHETIILPSFHRSGNTLTRELLEGVTQILTGSDDIQFHPLEKIVSGNFEIEQTDVFINFKGQRKTDQDVWVYKTHFPIRYRKEIFKFDRIILIVRNPFDTLESMFNLYLTGSHSKSIHNDEYRRLEQEWQGFINDVIPEWVQFHEYWLKYAEENNVPLYIIRYEDLLTDTKDEVMQMMKFLLHYQKIEGTVVEEKIDSYLLNRRTVYKPRKGTSFHSLTNYSEELIKHVFEKCRKMLKILGYDRLLSQKLNNYEQIKDNENALDIDGKTILTHQELNEINLAKFTQDENYPFDEIRIPLRLYPHFEINTDDEYKSNRAFQATGKRVNRLANEIKKIVKLDES
jgi:hypothetical protein